jgi:hypothetical protein
LYHRLGKASLKDTSENRTTLASKKDAKDYASIASKVSSSTENIKGENAKKSLVEC